MKVPNFVMWSYAIKSRFESGYGLPSLILFDIEQFHDLLVIFKLFWTLKNSQSSSCWTGNFVLRTEVLQCVFFVTRVQDYIAR